MSMRCPSTPRPLTLDVTSPCCSAEYRAAHRAPRAGCRAPVAGRRSPVAGRLLPVVAWRSSVAGCRSWGAFFGSPLAVPPSPVRTRPGERAWGWGATRRYRPRFGHRCDAARRHGGTVTRRHGDAAARRHGTAAFAVALRRQVVQHGLSGFQAVRGFLRCVVRRRLGGRRCRLRRGIDRWLLGGCPASQR